MRISDPLKLSVDRQQAVVLVETRRTDISEILLLDSKGRIMWTYRGLPSTGLPSVILIVLESNIPERPIDTLILPWLKRYILRILFQLGRDPRRRPP